MKVRLYRAADDSEASTASAFSPDEDVARAYLDNPGFGGSNLYRYDVEVDRDRVLDLYEDRWALQTLGEALGFSGGPLDDFKDKYAHDYIFEVIAEGWLREGESVRKVPFIGILARDFDWVKYEDNFPNTEPPPETWVMLSSRKLRGRRMRV